MTDSLFVPDARFEEEPAPRGLPYDSIAEQSVLGAMMLHKDAIDEVLGVLRPQDYYRPAHETIHRCIVQLYLRGEPCDPITVSQQLAIDGDLSRVGDISYLHTVVNTVPTAANAGWYAEIVHDRAVRRRLAGAGTRIAGMGLSGEGELTDLVALAQGELAQVEDSRAEEEMLPVGQTLDQTLELMAALADPSARKPGVMTGFTDLDNLTNGLQPGQLIVIAARPGVGKSTLALDCARAAAKAGTKTAFFSLEMSRDELTMRLLSAEAGVALHKMRTGNLTDEDWGRIGEVHAEVSEMPLSIDVSPNSTAVDIRSKSRRFQQLHGLGLVVVDYMQLMRSGMKTESRQAEVSEISRSLKLLAKELNLPVIALSQLNRGPEQRTDRKPQLSDLRESGSIEQDSDIVILIHREDSYEKESSRAGEADLIVAKHRNGQTPILTVAFQGHYSRFKDMHRDDS